MRSRLLLACLLLGSTPALAGTPEIDADGARRGVAFLSSSVGRDVTAEEILAFVETCRIDLVVFDFAWVTAHFDRTDFGKLEALAGALADRGVVVAAMYRPRALRREDADVHYAMDAEGRIPEEHLDLCYSHEDSVAWGLSFGRGILERCPSIRHLILYNLRSPCACELCRDGQSAAHVSNFLEACRREWKKVRPGVRIGHVGGGDEYADRLDFLLPFLSVQRSTPDRPVDVPAELARIAALRSRVAPKPVVPLAKVCWENATENTTEDVAAAIRESDAAMSGFLLWYYGWIFRSETDRYDAAALVTALGGDPARMEPFFRAPEATAANGDQWIYFDSMETATGPVLSVRGRGGERTVAPEADHVLISYLADGVYAALPSLSISLGDTNRVLIRFPEKAVAGARSAELRLRMHQSGIPVAVPFGLAVHRVTEQWDPSNTAWNAAPAFEPEPLLVVPVDPDAEELVIDLSAWAASRDVRHGLLLKVEKAVPTRTVPPPAPPPAEPWTQPEIRTGTPFSDRIPWAADLEEALARAKESGRPVLATVVPVGDRRWVSGFAGAAAVWKGQTAHPFGDERAMEIDAGLAKERAMMAALFTDPAIAHLVTNYFEPVRIRLHTYSFDEGASKPLEDPLRALGARAVDLGGPALLFADADGKPLHACRRMAVFSAPMVREMLLAVLAKAGAEEVKPLPENRPASLRKAWELAGAGRTREALARLGRTEAASPEADYLRGCLLLRAEDGEAPRAAFQRSARADPTGPWGSRAEIRLRERGIHLEEWEALVEMPVPPLAGSTEVGAGNLTTDEVLESAVDYLLLHQAPDGGWPDPFTDVHPLSGPGSMYDMGVPRTGLVVDALLQMRARLPRRRAELDRAIERGIAFVGRFAEDPPDHVWRLTYALHLQNAILGSDLPAEAKRKARERARKLILALAAAQQMGGWSYVPAPRIHSFNTAPVLLLLAELHAHGVESPKTMRDRAADFLESLREKDEPGEFAYAKNIRHRLLKASSCRTALCELALATHRGTDATDGIRRGVELFFANEAPVRDAAKVFEAYFSPTAMHDAYHYYFGHYYTARAMALLPPEEARRHARRQVAILLPQREFDGSFVDAQMQGKSYGTAMVLLTLLQDLRLLDE